jgi:hypothetical protein
MATGERTGRTSLWWGLLPILLAVLLGGLLPASSCAAATPSFVEQSAIVVGGEPKFLLFDAEGSRLFASDFAGDRVVVVDLPSGLAVGGLQVPDGPAGLALSADGRWLFVASYWGGHIYRFDLADLAKPPLARFMGDDSCPWDLKTVRGAGGRELLAVTLHHKDTLALLDAATLDTVASFPTAWFPYMMDVDFTAGLLYAVAYGGPLGGEVLCVDVVRMRELWRAPAGRGAFDVRVAPGGAESGNVVEPGSVFVVDFNGQAVTMFGPEGEDRGSLRLEGTPRNGRFSATGDRFYVSLQARNQVAELSAGTLEAVGAVGTGSRPGALEWVTAVLPFAPEGESGSSSSAWLAVGNQGDGTISLLGLGDAVPGFADVPADHLFARDIRVLALRGALSGYPPESGVASAAGAADGTGTASGAVSTAASGAAPAAALLFRPEDPLARAQAAKVVVAALSLHTAEIEPAAIEFTDVSEETGTYPFDYVQEATRAGIVGGVSSFPPRFSPYTPVTRLQLLRMLVRGAEAVGTPLPTGRGSSPFYDIGPAHPDFAVIMTAYRAGLTAGVPGPDGHLRLRAYEPASRGQTARMVCNLLAALGRALTFGPPAG